jgi:hypothetical protein
MLLLIPTPNTAAEEVPLVEQCRDFFNFRDFEKTLELANRIYENPANKRNQALLEEMLYFINESGEELKDQLQKKINMANANTIRTQALNYRKKFKIQIDIQEDGFYYIVTYRRDALRQLMKLNPKSPYLEYAQLKSLLRLSQYATDPLFRFNEDLRMIGLYQTYISNYPGSQYLPNLIGRIADLYFNVYEQALVLKNQLGYSDAQVNAFYDQSMALYKKVIREFPGSAAASSIGEIRIDEVKLRKDPNTKSQMIKRLKMGTLVKIVERSAERYSISNMYDYWYKIRLPDGVEGWVYGVYINTRYGR